MCVGKITAISYAVNQLCLLNFHFENVVLGRSVACQIPPRACHPHWSINYSLGHLHHLWRFWLRVSKSYLDSSTAGQVGAVGGHGRE